MSREQEDRDARERNVRGRTPVEYVQGAEAGFTVVEWHDKPIPEGHPDCVGIVFDSPAFTKAMEILDRADPGTSIGDAKLMIRLRSASAVNSLIEALRFHRNNVWPQGTKR